MRSIAEPACRATARRGRLDVSTRRHGRAPGKLRQYRFDWPQCGMDDGVVQV